MIVADYRALSFRDTGRSRISDTVRTILENQNLSTLSLPPIGGPIAGSAPSQLAGTTLELQRFPQPDLKSNLLLSTTFYRATVPSLASLSLPEFVTTGD